MYIINAVDNFEVWKYIDNEYIFYDKPLIESGRLGTKAQIQIIIPLPQYVIMIVKGLIQILYIPLKYIHYIIFHQW